MPTAELYRKTVKVNVFASKILFLTLRLPVRRFFITPERFVSPDRLSRPFLSPLFKVYEICGLSPQAENYYRQLAERKLSWRMHLRKIVALTDVYGAEKVARALADALVYHAFSSDYIANILEQGERWLPEPGPLHLTRKQDLLDLQLPEPDLSVYETEEEQPEPGDNADEAKA